MNPKITKLRGRIAAAQDRVAYLESGQARVTKALAIERLNAWLSFAETEGTRVLRDWSVNLTFQHTGASGSMLAVGDPFAIEKLLIAINPEAARTRLMAIIDAEYSAIGDALDPAQIPKLLEQARAELFALETEDFLQSEAAGIRQRIDIDPRLLLGI